MSNPTLILIAVGLAMDAFAVSVGSGIAIHRMHIKHAMVIALFFGVFQAVMPLVGWLAGREAAALVGSCDHWIAFALLAFVGGKMIWEAMHAPEDGKAFDPLNIYVLFILAIATSIDAFAVGVSLSFLDVSIMRPVLVIGAVTFVVSFAGTYIGDMFGHLCEKKLLIVAGLVLIGMGVKILLT